ncbi:MAG TPA: hypothetical protein VEA69_07255 [Tepidisphaeraceae bacterium]|nr:hypothetical protein [Tepidisphaeraceae bacterium]
MPAVVVAAFEPLILLAGGIVATALMAAAALIIFRNNRKTGELRHHLTDGTLSPRNQHYAFAHSYLRSLAFEDPDRLVIALAAPEADDLLFELWNAVGKDLAQAGEEPGQTGSEGLEAVPARVAGRPCALVKLPAPAAATEAYFVAIVLNHDIDEPPKSPPEPALFYFTLERGVPLGEGDRTLFAEWDAGGTHKLIGDAPPPDARTFLDHVAAHLSGRPAAPTTSA